MSTNSTNVSSTGSSIAPRYLDIVNMTQSLLALFFPSPQRHEAMATEDEGRGRGGQVSGAIVSLEEQDKGQWNKPSVFLLRAVPRAPTTRAALTSSLSAGEMSWRDLDIAEPLLRLRVAMLDQMLPTPRVELEVVDEDEPEAGGRDGDYYESYNDLGVHELMLRDRPRMVAYYDSIMRNAAFIQGKVVLDVGCGTGVLAMMAARAGLGACRRARRATRDLCANL
ncbi:MAG: hypothetical protein ACPIOQ_30000 [Promethearchaeia archaeon]